MERGIHINRMISELTRSPHGDLAQYVATAKPFVAQDQEFYAHLIAWNHKNGQIRDAKVALPVIGLTVDQHPELLENALAHIASLDPRNYARAIRFAKGQGVSNRQLRRLTTRYLRAREASPKWWDRTVLQHRASMKELYALFHIKPGDRYNEILFQGKKVGVHQDLAQLKNMEPRAAAGVIFEKRIPFLTALGALGVKAKEPDVVMALIDRMSATELVTNSKALQRLGVDTNPVLKAAYDSALEKVRQSRQATLKTGKAAAATGNKKVAAVQETQLDAMAVKGDWLVLCDISQSMHQSIELSRQIAAVLARVAEGNVELVFFNHTARSLNVTGQTLEEIEHATRFVRAGGGTSIGVGLSHALARGVPIDGIAVVSDGGERHMPGFAQVYEKLCEQTGKQVPVYHYLVKGFDPNWLASNMERAGHEMQLFDVRGGVDYYALPNLVQTMRTNQYSLSDEILATPLLMLDDVFAKKERTSVQTAA